jgi:hypothetical protein
MSHDDQSLGGLTEALGLNPVASPADPLLEMDVGGCKLLRRIAEGGMGRVYEGLQDKPRRPVAVKVMRPGCVSRESHQRFEREWELLGRLRHPHIAQVYSAGLCVAAGTQVPYIVMEYIADALPLTEFARCHGLTMEARIKLFRKVCKAMAHAHEKSVIHRDLKPSNILVEPSGVPKVIDFGVARMNDKTSEPMTAITDFGQALGTVQYMSPEQFVGDSSQIDSSADVYALGVILYELLTGQLPYDVRRKPIHEAAKAVMLHTVTPPSQLNSSIPPAVEGVIEICLRKDRTARFANAKDLASALNARQTSGPAAALSQRPSQSGKGVAPPAPSVSAQGPDVLACPHCDRMFRETPEVLGKKIRCRGCRQIFHVPKDTGSIPVEAPASAEGERCTAPPVAATCVVDGQDARSCPECGRVFLMKPAFAGKKIRCRVCKALFRVIASGAPSDAPVHAEEAQPSASSYTIFEDIGDLLEELRPGERVECVVRPLAVAARRSCGPSNWLPNPFRRPFF